MVQPGTHLVPGRCLEQVGIAARVDRKDIAALERVMGQIQMVKKQNMLTNI